MEWRGRRGSRNIEDRRAQPGGLRRVSAGRAGGVGGLGLVAVLVIGYVLGIDVTPLLNGQGGIGAPAGPSAAITPADEEAAAFVSVTLADTEEIWAAVFREQLGTEYRPATLVLFKGATQSPCGGANGATGPFYCPADQKVYLDTAFFTTLEQRLGAGGDFAAAYVVAHEVAHHVQNRTGTLGQANAIRQRSSEAESNAISVRIELQADCYSGIWAREASARLGTIEPGDFEEALNAARQIGDDTLQRAAGQRPMPHTFTHGTSEQRAAWFERGLRTGDMAACDTFSAETL
mgnify:CR=1 FL=1